MHSPCSLGMLCLLAHLLWLARRASSCFKPGTLSATLVVLAVPSPCCRGCALKAWYVHAPFFSTQCTLCKFPVVDVYVHNDVSRYRQCGLYSSQHHQEPIGGAARHTYCAGSCTCLTFSCDRIGGGLTLHLFGYMLSCLLVNYNTFLQEEVQAGPSMTIQVTTALV